MSQEKKCRIQAVDRYCDIGDGLHYRTKMVVAGNYLDVSAYPKGGNSGGGYSNGLPKTPEAVRKANYVKAQKRLVHLLHCNFMPDDRFVTFTYEFPCDEAYVRKNIRSIVGKLRRRALKKGIELKYLYVVESTLSREGVKRWHIHMLLNNGIVTLEELEALWPQGMINNRPIRYESDGLTGLAQYITKAKTTQEKMMQHRWACSKNLKRPIEFIHDDIFDHELVRELSTETHNVRREIVE